MAMDIEKIVCSLGAKNVRAINPNDLKQVRGALDWALALDEPSVIITKWPCALKKFTDEDMKEFPNAFKGKSAVGQDKCTGCKLCLRCGCPALALDKKTEKAAIDMQACVGCGVCGQICPSHAITSF